MLENGMTTREVWDTTKTVVDADEHSRAIQVRGKCRSVVTAVCAASPNGGLLCLQANRDKLDAAISEARKLADDFNRTATITRISVGVWIGEIMPDDMEAMRRINQDMRDLLADMESGVKNLDAAQIREAANRATKMTQMLTPDAAQRLDAAIAIVRTQARKIVKAGETAIADIDRNTFATLAAARTAFLDIDTPQGEIGDVQGAAAAIDLEPAAIAPMAAPVVTGIELE
jgi:hypothetical protein